MRPAGAADPPEQEARTSAATGQARQREQARRAAEEAAQGRLEAALSSISEAFLTFDEDWRCTYINRRAAEIMGAAVQELQGVSLWELSPEMIGTPFYRQLHRAAEQRRPVNFTYFYPPSQRWYECRAYPGKKELSLFITDVTLRKRAEQGQISERRASERRQQFFTKLNSTVRELSDPVEIVKATAHAVGRYLGVSRCAYGIVDDDQQHIAIECDYCDGVPSVVGAHRMDDFGPDAFADHHRSHAVAIADIENDPRTADYAQSFRAYKIRARLSVPLIRQNRLVAIFFVHHHEPRAWSKRDVALVQEVAERTWLVLENERALRALRESEARSRTQAEQLAETDRRKNEFLAMLAHELRNPLTPIQSAVDLIDLQAAPLDPKLRWSIDVIARQTSLIARLVDDLLDVARITRGRIELHKEEIDLNDVVASAIETARPLINGNGHHLNVSLAAEPLMLYADAMRIGQIMINLLNNAAKYTPSGGEIDLQIARHHDKAVIRVRDNGIGIAAEILPRLFDIFTQAGVGLDRSQGGLGLGLTLVRRLSELHGGSVEAFSEGEGRGAEFVVRLPVYRRTETRIPVQTQSQTPPPRARHFRILVVDDNADVADGLRFLLRELGHEVETAADGKQALESAARFRPRVVLLDIGLPGMDGHEVARRLRAQYPGKLLLIALTGYGDDETVRRAREAGFDHHVLKPGDLDTLEDLLASVED